MGQDQKCEEAVEAERDEPTTDPNWNCDSLMTAEIGIVEVCLLVQLELLMVWANQQCEKESYY